MRLGTFKGFVLEYKASKKFGFIRVTHEVINEKDIVVSKRYDEVFIFVTDIESSKNEFKKLIQGQQVEFEMFRNDKGLKASNLKIIGERYDDFGEINYNSWN